MDSSVKEINEMSKLLISTQVFENYAIHADGSFGTGAEAYWKAKGGSEYVVKSFNGFTHRSIAESAQAMVDRVRSEIECDNEAFREHIIGWTVVADDYLTEFERMQLDYEGVIRFPAKEITVPA